MIKYNWILSPITFLVLSVCAVSAGATGLSYADGQVFPHGYVDFKQTGPLAMTDYPFASSGRRLVFETSYRALYNISELADSRAAMAYSFGQMTVGAAAAIFGKADYYQQTGLSSFASWRKGAVAVGAALVYNRVSFGRYSALSITSGNIGAAFQRDALLLYGVARTINQPRYCAKAEQLPPEGEIGVSYKSGAYLDNQAKALFVRRQKPTAQLLQAFRLSSFAQVSWSLVLSPVRFGAGLNLEKGHLGFGYSFSHHPVLGPTHAVSLLVF